MTALIVTAAQGGLPAPFGVDFRVGVDGAPASSITSPFEIPAGASWIEVAAVPASGAVWPVSAEYLVEADGSLTPAGPTPGFTPPLSAFGTTTLVALMSRVRDATASSADGLKAVVTNAAVANQLGFGVPRAAGVPQSWRQPDGSIVPPVDFASPSLERLTTLCLPPYDSVGPRTTFQYVRPASTTRVLELIGDPVPRLFGVSWTDDLLAGGARPLPFLVYFHHGIGQEVAGGFWTGAAGAYPFGYDPSTYGLWRYLHYGADPAVAGLGEKGISFQVEAAGRDVVSIVPLNRLGQEAGQAVKASWLRELLLDVQQFIHAWAGIPFVPAGFDRLAVAGFSSGNLFAAQLVQSAVADGSFAEDLLQEVYYFDPPGDLHAVCLSAAAAFANQTTSPKRVRFYGQGVPAALGTLIPNAVLVSPHVRSDSTGRRTAIDLPVGAWKQWLESRGWTAPDWRVMHQLIAGICLTDALRRSELPRRQRRESGWRWCQTCQALFDSSFVSVCPVGGAHDGSASGAYEVRLEEGDPVCQPGWRWCNRCQGLYYGVRPAPGSCPAGGDHDSSIGPEYEVAVGGTASDVQDGWRWCARCQSLWFGGGGAGVCPGGGGHDGSTSANYALAVT